jgi:hypothetical protein
MTRLALASALLATAALLFPAASPAEAWAGGSFDGAAEDTMASLISAEHARVCGTTLLRAFQHDSIDRWRAKDMVVRGYFSHIIKGTSRNVFSYFADYGIRGYLGGGEIIAWNMYPDDVAAGAAFNSFMGSPGHRAVIRSCSNNTFGVGAFKGTNGRKMFAVTFSRQPVERSAASSLRVRYGPGVQFATRFIAPYGARQVVFDWRYDGLERRWDYGRFSGIGWGWAPDWLTR